MVTNSQRRRLEYDILGGIVHFRDIAGVKGFGDYSTRFWTLEQRPESPDGLILVSEYIVAVWPTSKKVFPWPDNMRVQLVGQRISENVKLVEAEFRARGNSNGSDDKASMALEK